MIYNLIKLIISSFSILLISELAKKNSFAGGLFASIPLISILAFFIIGAILTPPDVVSQIIFVIPMAILYEISIIICKLIENDK